MRSSKDPTRFASSWSKTRLARSRFRIGLLPFLIAFCAQAQDHVGKPIPKYLTGDECLFCHRSKLAADWQPNRHAQTMRQNEDSPGEFVLGSRQQKRRLKTEGYGKVAILTAENAWDSDRFGNRCAGCHATAVDVTSKTFQNPGLECYTCHGVVPLEHTNDTSLVWLSKKRRNDVKAITSICAQCHLRNGKSRSSGLPYPNTFVAGDNLFKDYQADFSKADDLSLNAGDRHVLRNVRDVLEHGSEVTCLSCHQIHPSASLKHHRVARSEICLDCHNAEGPSKVLKAYTVHSSLCEY